MLLMGSGRTKRQYAARTRLCRLINVQNIAAFAALPDEKLTHKENLTKKILFRGSPRKCYSFSYTVVLQFNNATAGGTVILMFLRLDFHKIPLRPPSSKLSLSNPSSSNPSLSSVGQFDFYCVSQLNIKHIIMFPEDRKTDRQTDRRTDRVFQASPMSIMTSLKIRQLK